MSEWKVLLSGGGTGGHIMPALAVAQELQSLENPPDILYVGTDDRMEGRIVPERGLPFRSIRISGFARGFSPSQTWRNLKLILRLLSLAPLRQALRILREFQPDVVLGTGGYVTGPVLLGAALSRIPTLILEQNANPGLTNRLLTPVVRWVGLPHASEHPYWQKRKSKTLLLGNPVRREIIEAQPEESRVRLGLDANRLTLGCLGGSLGSKALNQAFVQLLASPELKQWAQEIQAIHSCGGRFFEEQRDSQPPIAAYRPFDFIEDMGAFYAACDLIVCRAGATTLAEASARGVPLILVPWEGAANAEQRVNAERLVQAGAAILLDEDSLSQGALENVVSRLLKNPEELQEMKQKCQQMGIPDASSRVAQQLLKMAKRR